MQQQRSRLISVVIRQGGCELSWQLRGECGPRQVGGARVGLQHNLGLGGACVITMYKRPEEWAGVAPKRAVSGAMGFADKARL